MVVEQSRDRLGTEEPLPAHVRAREDVSRERLQVGAEPSGKRDRKPPLGAVDDRLGKEGGDGTAQQPLLRESADLVAAPNG